MSSNAEVIQTNFDIIFNDTYVAINKLLALCNRNVPRYVIRNYLTELPGFPSVSLYGLVELIVRCNGIPKVRKITADEISNGALPAIGHISCNGKDGVYVTLIKVEGPNVTYLGPDNLIKIETIAQLAERWSGFIIDCEFEQTNSNEDEFKFGPGYEAQKNYIDTIMVQDNFISTKECDEIIRISEEQSVYERSLVELLNEDAVKKCQPDFTLMKMTGEKVIITAPGKLSDTSRLSDTYDFVSRFFAQTAGVDEDPVTGSAH